MSNRPIGWTSSDDPKNYRLPRPSSIPKNKSQDAELRRLEAELSRDVVQCGWELKRVERPKPPEPDPREDERMREAARLVNDPATRGDFYRRLIKEKHDAQHGKMTAQDEDFGGYLLRKFGVNNLSR